MLPLANLLNLPYQFIICRACVGWYQQKQQGMRQGLQAAAVQPSRQAAVKQQAQHSLAKAPGNDTAAASRG